MILDMASAYMLFSILYKDDKKSKQQQQQELVRRRNLQALTLLRIRNTIRTRNYLTTSDLPDPHNSEWYNLYKKGADGNFISVTGLNREGFQHLLRFFKRDYVILSERHHNGGRPAKLEKHMVLGLVLHFYATTADLKSICVMFGVPPSTLSRTLAKAEVALNRSLRRMRKAFIKWPTFEQQREWAQLMERKEPLITQKWGVIDGKSYKVQRPSNSERQTALNNGWLDTALVTGVFCLGCDGTLVWGKHNCPWSWKEDISSFEEKLIDSSLTLPGYGVVADSDFPCSDPMVEQIVTPLKEHEFTALPFEARRGARLRHNAIVSLRQSVEWGMDAVEKVFRRLQQPLPYNPETRGRRLDSIYRLYNFRVRTTGISQIRTVFYGNM